MALSSLDPQPHGESLLGWYFWLPQNPACSGLWIESGLQSPCTNPLLVRIVLFSHPADILWPDPHAWWASSQLPVPGSPPTTSQTARLALSNQTPEPQQGGGHNVLRTWDASSLQRPVVPAFALTGGPGCSLASTNAMVCFERWVSLASFIPAMVFKTCSWLYLYWPSPSNSVQQL